MKMHRSQSKNEYEIAVVVCAYNPSIDKLLRTLESCVTQEGVRLQIVVADDGSKVDYFDTIKSYFSQKQFADYKIVRLDRNQGTVQNLLNGVKSSSATYVKFLSPGDYFINIKTLKNWIRFLEESQQKWSFADAVYYRISENNENVIVVEKAHPQIVSVYKRQNREACRWNYLVNDDIALGAATLAYKEVCVKYLEKLKGKVIYAEDHIWRLMMYDDIVGGYYPCNVIMYEWGTGISTSGSDVWCQRLEKDWNSANEIIINTNEEKDVFQRQVERIILNRKEARIKKWIINPRRINKLRYKLTCKFNPRKTSMLANNHRK